MTAALGIQSRTATDDSAISDAVEELRNCILQSLNDRRVTARHLSARLLTIVYREPASTRCTQLVSKCLELKQGCISGPIQITVKEETNITDQERRVESAVRFRSEMYTASLSSWFMNPLTRTLGMRESSVNESQVLRSLRVFFDRNMVSGISRGRTIRYCVNYL